MSDYEKEIKARSYPRYIKGLFARFIQNISYEITRKKLRRQGSSISRTAVIIKKFRNGRGEN